MRIVHGFSAFVILWLGSSAAQADTSNYSFSWASGSTTLHVGDTLTPGWTYQRLGNPPPPIANTVRSYNCCGGGGCSVQARKQGGGSGSGSATESGGIIEGQPHTFTDGEDGQWNVGLKYVCTLTITDLNTNKTQVIEDESGTTVEQFINVLKANQ